MNFQGDVSNSLLGVKHINWQRVKHRKQVFSVFPLISSLLNSKQATIVCSHVVKETILKYKNLKVSDHSLPLDLTKCHRNTSTSSFNTLVLIKEVVKAVVGKDDDYR